MACNSKISANILYSCTDTPKKGLDGGEAVLINYADIDKATSTVNATGETITNLALASGSVGYKVQWYKDLASTATTFTPNAEDFDGFQHQFACRLFGSTADNALVAAQLKGGRFAVVVETTYKGSGSLDAFKVYGYDSGMELSEMTGNSNENSGTLLFTLSTKEGVYEEFPYHIWLETDYTTTKAGFSSLTT